MAEKSHGAIDAPFLSTSSFPTNKGTPVSNKSAGLKQIQSFQIKEVENCNFQGTITYPTEREKENHLQNCLGMLVPRRVSKPIAIVHP